ncbi:MAG: hypothetical protein AAGE93_21160 [Bacteroidota bacterium]
MIQTTQPYRPTLTQQYFSARFVRHWMGSAIFFFWLAAIFGTLMRYYFVNEVPFLEYKHLLHAHSHVALLGWAYPLVSGALLFLLLQHSQWLTKYRYLLGLNVVSAVGMAIFFLYQGYGLYSISFSAVHLLSAYAFAYYFLKDLAALSPRAHTRFVRWGIYWLLVSTLGLWAIGPVSALLGKLHPLYFASIQFFLHFQFNGWLTYAIVGLWLFHIERSGKSVAVSTTGFWLLQASLLLTYALSVTWSTPLSMVFYLNTLGVLLQVVAFCLILRPVFIAANPFKRLDDWTDILFSFGVLCLLLKVTVQTAVALPAVAEISYTIRNYVIGFIHLITLGAITLTAVSLLLKSGLLPRNTSARAGWLLLLAAFILSELILFGQGTLLWLRQGFVAYYYEILFGVTALFPISLTIILLSYIRPKPPDTS